VIRGLIIALALVGTGCDHAQEVAGSGDMVTACGVAPGALCCTGDMGEACAPGLYCRDTRGGAPKLCEVTP